MMKKIVKKADKAGASFPENICLSDGTSKWNMDFILTVDKEIPDMENITLSGMILTKEYESNFTQTGQCHYYFEAYTKDQGHEIKNGINGLPHTQNVQKFMVKTT